LEALIGGVTDPVVLAGLARGRLRAKDEQLHLTSRHRLMPLPVIPAVDSITGLIFLARAS